jgi:hypothetical protein
MLFAVLKHFDSLREVEIGMQAEAHKRAKRLGKTALYDGFNHHFAVR